MHINYTEEQQMLRDSADKFLRDNYSFEHRQAVIKSGSGYSSAMWQSFAELGWLALPFEEEQGGFDWGALEIMLLSEKLGRYQVIEPFLETVLLAGGLLQAGNNQYLKDTRIGSLIDGSEQAAFAYAEGGCSLPAGKVKTTARETADGYILSGTKTVVYNGPAADFFIVSACLNGQKDNLVLLLVPADSAGLSRKNYLTYDGRHASELQLNNVEVKRNCLLADPLNSHAVICDVMQKAIIAVCAESLGAMEALLEATVEYTSQRKQFGQPIARFQVLRHRMADMFMELELSRSLLMAAAWHVDQRSDQADKLLAALKARVGKAGRFVSQNAIQLHGGIGVTDELNVGHYFKRLTIIENLFGSRDYHLSDYGKLSA